MKIGIFGGAFNPPHIGHVEAAKTAYLAQGLDLLIVIPTGTPPHKTMPRGTPAPEIRFLMTENAFSDMAGINVIVSDMEIYNRENNYTIDTIKAVQKKYSGSGLYLLVGNDMYDTLDTWKDSAALLKAVVPVLLPREVINISSTEIRALLPKQEGVMHLSELNYSLIIKNRFYDAKPNWDWLRNFAHSMLDEQRIPHVVACEIAAVQLAERWGADVDDAREAAILHDITKKLDLFENMCIITEHGLNADDYSKNEEKILHSITAAILAKSLFGVSDEVANAIRLHTTGSSGMTLLDKVIYIADYIESTRDFDGVGELRLKAYENIDEAVIMGVRFAIDDLCSRGITPNKASYDLLSDFGEQY